jgi:hypothetical protein
VKVLDEFPAQGVQRRRYDWDLLFDGKTRELERGVDFACLPSSFVRSIRRAARRRGVAVLVRHYFRSDERHAVVAVQAIGRLR